jgi:hypothetical protein
MTASPRVVAHLVVRDEMHRWLGPCLERLVRQFDTVTVFDDGSTDGSAEYARAVGCVVGHRPDHVPAFLEHEAACREYAWSWMIDAVELDPDDIVVALDADEIISGDRHTIRSIVSLSSACRFVCAIDEIFSVDAAGTPLRRVDGQWGRINGVRIARVGRQREFRSQRLGCGSVPAATGEWATTALIVIRHLGYLRPEDRRAKFDRYIGRREHRQQHVRSILTSPRLEPVPGVGIIERSWWRDVHAALNGVSS